MSVGVLCFDELGTGLGFTLVVVVIDMGCGGSKVDDYPLVTRCRERKELIKAAVDHRYAFASAHISYLHSLKEVGDVLRRFVEEELKIVSPSSSPVLTLPSDKGKNNKSSSSSTSISHYHSDHDDNVEGSHLHLSSSSVSELDSPSSGHIHIQDSPEVERISTSSPPSQNAWGPYGFTSPQQTGWDPYGYGVNMNSYTNTYYMKRSAPAVQSVIYEEPRRSSGEGKLPESSYMYSNSYENGGFFGFPMGSPPSQPYENRQPIPPAGPPPPPSPKVSTWDFLNPFDSYDSGYPGYYSQSRYGYSSIGSSPDSNEVREREGIPDLEDETENESFNREVHKGKKKVNEDMGTSSSRPVPTQNSEGSSRTVPSHSSEGSTREMPSRPSQNGEGTSRFVPSRNSEATESVHLNEEKSSPDTIVSKSPDDGYTRKKGVSFEVDEASTHGVESSKLSSLTTLSAHGTRDLLEVVLEIRDEFRVASSYGKEVALMLEVGKIPYQPRFTVLKVLLSRILYKRAPFLLSSQPASRRSVRLAGSTVKLAKSYFGDSGKDMKMRPTNLSSTLEKLYVWEKKLYKEVKDEERLRVIYLKKCNRLKVLDDRGAESRKIDLTLASIRKLQTKLNVGVKAIDAISSRIHKLRDEELQPQINELIHGLSRMWKAMFNCHQKQFQAILDSKTRSLRAKTGFRRDSSLRATLELEVELRIWCNRFKNWIETQKSFVVSLNGWLLRCLLYEPEETADGVVPFSPGRIGAPPIFVISNDWVQAVENISGKGVANAMEKFARILQKLSEKQEEEQRQRLKVEYISKDFQRRLRTLRTERSKIERDQDELSIVSSGSGVSPMDDLKVDLDSMRERLDEERRRHKEAAKKVRNAASSSLQSDLVPIFEALGNFSSEALKAYELVRIQNGAQSSEGK